VSTLSLRRISSKDHADFLDGRAEVSFLQRPEWALVKPDWRAESLGFFDGDTQVGAALVLHRQAPVVKRSLAYVPDGPVVDFSKYSSRDVLPLLADHLRKGGAFALRIGPAVDRTVWSAVDVRKAMGAGELNSLDQLKPVQRFPEGDKLANELTALGFSRLDAGLDFAAGQPEYVARVPLVDQDGKQLDVDQVLARFSQSGRRETRQSLKQDLTIEVGTEQDMDRFHALYATTADRQEFTGRPVSYFRTLHKALNQAVPGSCTLYFASKDGVDLATAIRLRSGKLSWYLYGASGNEQRKLNAPKALQHRMISDAISEGCLYLDQGGVTPTLSRQDAHGGLSYFKTSMGCDVVRTEGEWELPLRKILAWGFDKYMAWRARR